MSKIAVLRGLLCHNLTTNMEPIVERSQFYDTDPYVVSFLSLSLPSDKNKYKLIFYWTHQSGYNKVIETDLPPHSGVLNIYSYISPVLIKKIESTNPVGIWKLKITVNGNEFVDIKFVVERNSLNIKSASLDFYA